MWYIAYTLCGCRRIVHLFRWEGSFTWPSGNLRGISHKGFAGTIGMVDDIRVCLNRITFFVGKRNDKPDIDIGRDNAKYWQVGALVLCLNPICSYEVLVTCTNLA
ncbi:unnamed protein product [Arabidopsis thaliana]|uniref:Uncharacterized protein n=1 Tax=Arabidopsis thaliana TaxID=3702 RepID=A0A654ES20_ARATH|nr:unnamed protein product [Arabidopsis thaliana]